GVADGRVVAGAEQRGGRRGELTRVLEDAVDGDVRVLLLEQGDVLEPLLVLLRSAGGWRAVDADRHVAAAATAGGGTAREPGGREPESRDDGDPGRAATSGSSVKPSGHCLVLPGTHTSRAGKYR